MPIAAPVAMTTTPDTHCQTVVRGSIRKILESFLMQSKMRQFHTDPRPRGSYVLRSASTGSTFIARRAGTNDATTAAATSVTATAPIVTGSHGWIL
jgi:hypothetical protein